MPDSAGDSLSPVALVAEPVVAAPSTVAAPVLGRVALAAVYEVEIDFGDLPVAEGAFVIANPNVGVGSAVQASMVYAAATGKDLDECEMDDLIFRCAAGDGQVTMFVRAADGSYLHGCFRVAYMVG